MDRTKLKIAALSTLFIFAVGLPGLQRSCKQNSTRDANDSDWPLTEADSALWVGQKLARDLGWPEPEKAAQALAVIVKKQHDEVGTSYRELYSVPVFQDTPAPDGQ